MTIQNKDSNNNTYEGKLFTGYRGMGFVIVDLGTDTEWRIDIPNEITLNTGLHGDTVLVMKDDVSEAGAEYPTGKVIKINERAQTKFVGVIQKNDRSAFLIPDNKKSYKDFYIPLNDSKGVKNGQKAYVELVQWTDPNRNPQGRVLQIIGEKGSHETEMRSLVLEKGFDPTFPEDVAEEAREISREITSDEIENRRDMREVTTFTIDPDTAKDFDDALSFRTLESGDVEIGIHIADVTHYVKSGMKIEREALQRATSVYLVDRTIPMLPEVLSNDMCSLMPDVDRLAFSAIFTFSKNSFTGENGHEIKDEWYGRTIIHSNRRFTYQQAEDIIKAGEGEYESELTSLMGLSRVLRKERFANGAIGFETDEIKIDLDEDCKPVAIVKKEHLETHALIEEFMLLANRKVAKFVTDKIEREHKQSPFVYRVHDEPDRDRMENFISFIRPLGYKLEFKKGGILSSDLNHILKQSQGKPEESIIHVAAIRTMAKAVYSTGNIGHYGLAFEYYTHFTSPIRRYPDMMVHRLLEVYLKDETPKKKMNHYQEMCLHASSREKDASDAERDSIKYKQVEYMKPRIGEKFKGVISGISKAGIFVQEKETLAEGLIRLRELHDDFYVLDEKNYRFIGQNNEKTFSLGDELDIKLIKADLDLKQIDYTIV